MKSFVRHFLGTISDLACEATDAQRCVYIGGLLLIASGLLHIIPAILFPVDFGSPLSWRKPILFGISTGVTLLSLGWILGLVRSSWKSTLAYGLTGFALLEVFLISLQTWRGEASHFNNSTPLNTVIHITIDGSILLITAVIVYLTALTLVQNFHRDSAMRIAVRAGMILLTFSCFFGTYMLYYGMMQISRGEDPRFVDGGGVLKFVHGITIHTIQYLPLLAWFSSYGIGQSAVRTRLVSAAVAGQVLLLIYAWNQTFGGQGRFELDALSFNFMALLLGVAGSALPYLLAGWAAISRGYSPDLRH